MKTFGKSPFLECSSAGYKAYSAFYARLKKFEMRSIEELYQGFKRFTCEKCEGCGTLQNIPHNLDPNDSQFYYVCDVCQGAGYIDGLPIMKAKGRSPINTTDCVAFYDYLWKLYFYENPNLIDPIMEATGLSDIFGSPNSLCCQAEVLWRIKTGALPLFTSVVNIYKHKYDVYCGRAGKNQDGKWGNAHPVEKFCHLCGFGHRRGEAVGIFEKEFYTKVERDQQYRNEVLKLRGKRLGCFCVKEPNDGTKCHCNIYRDFINDYFGDIP